MFNNRFAFPEINLFSSENKRVEQAVKDYCNFSDNISKKSIRETLQEDWVNICKDFSNAFDKYKTKYHKAVDDN